MVLCCGKPRTACKRWKKAKACMGTHRNWVVVVLVAAVSQSCYAFTLPSMYQFVTTPRICPPGEQNSTFWPGLGESDYFYSWAVSVFPIGEVLMSLLAAYLSTTIPYLYTIPLTCCIAAGGGLMYALATHGVMVIVARFLFGTTNGLSLVLAQAYIGRTVRENKGKNGPSIEKMLLFYSIAISGSLIAATGMSALMSQFPNVNPYRWGGWFIVAVAVLYTFTFLSIYSNTKPMRPICICVHTLLRQRSRIPSRTAGLTKQVIIYGFIILYVYVQSSAYSIIDTLVNPILSDQFGLGTGSISYFMLGVTILWSLSSMSVPVMERLKIDSRIGLVAVTTMMMIGALLLADWHGFDTDTCDYLSRNMSTLEGESNPTKSNSDLSGWGSSSGWYDHVVNSNDNVTSLITDFDRELCESLSSSRRECFWNPKSRVTGEHCTTCRPVCLNAQKSLNFIQFSIGIALIAVLLQPGVVFYIVVASSVTKKNYQGVVMGALYCARGLSHTVTPFWLIATYEESIQHTYIPMSSLTVMFAVVTLLSLLLYKWMGPGKASKPLQFGALYPTPSPRKSSIEEELSSAVLFLDSVHKWMDSSTSSTSFHGHKMATDTVCSPENDPGWTLATDGFVDVTFQLGEEEKSSSSVRDA